MMDDRWYAATYEATEASEFLRYLKTHKNHFAFVEECGTTVSKYDTEFDWVTTTGRHLGHSLYLSTHRYRQLSTTLRTQCTKAFLFSCENDDAADLAKRYHEPELLGLAELPPLFFFEVSRFGATKLYKLDPSKRTWKLVRSKERKHVA